MRAPAKINLSLAVLGTRADGFHEIESLVLVVNWFDELAVSGRTGSGIELSCDVPGLPLDDANTVRRAATLLARRAGVAASARIELRKHERHSKFPNPGTGVLGPSIVTSASMGSHTWVIC